MSERVAQVRGVLAERIVVSTMLDPYFSLKGLASYSSISVRKLREHMDDVSHPLPVYKVGAKLLVRRSEFDSWIARYRQAGSVDVDRIVAQVLKDL